MSWSFPIARLLGSEIRIHVTFFLLLAWIGIAHYQRGGWPAAIEGIVFILALFACVIAHEFGHALAARRYGIRTPDITLLPIGGLARLERMPEKPGQEIVVALAGPAVNVVIALVLILIMNARFDMQALQQLDNPALSFIVRLASVNIFLVLFNLIPAFPMDGGRVLRALLALRFSRTQATNIAARIGQALAFVFGADPQRHGAGAVEDRQRRAGARRDDSGHPRRARHVTAGGRPEADAGAQRAGRGRGRSGRPPGRLHHAREYRRADDGGECRARPSPTPRHRSAAAAIEVEREGRE
jgi:Zn-dependent protease